MTNETMRKFGHPETLLRDYQHWALLVRPAQPTLGSLLLAAKGEATAFGALPDGAYAELQTATADIEAALGKCVAYQRINYLMLMMVDPHVHFHVVPRYEGSREWNGLSLVDHGWPGPPDLKSAPMLDSVAVLALRDWISAALPGKSDRG